tara:strand:+ start:564 stop:863 length:300 start_codon:yes stop_codon:yes gene_type:complete
MNPVPKKEDQIGEALIYERANGVVYARFRDKPKSEIYPGRWIIGGTSEGVAQAQGYLSYDSWKELFILADIHPTLRKQLDNTLNLYYIVKDGGKHEICD